MYASICAPAAIKELSVSVDELIDVKGVFNSTESVGYSDVEQLKRIVCSGLRAGGV